MAGNARAGRLGEQAVVDVLLADGATTSPAPAVVMVDRLGNPVGAVGASASTTSAQLGGAAIPLTAAGGVQIQIAGLTADQLTITHSMDGTNYRAAYLMKEDLSQVSSGVLTASQGGNGIYSVVKFGGYLKILRTGTADTLAVAYRGTN